jgi:hypothetical protein
MPKNYLNLAVKYGGWAVKIKSFSLELSFVIKVGKIN